MRSPKLLMISITAVLCGLAVICISSQSPAPTVQAAPEFLATSARPVPDALGQSPYAGQFIVQFAADCLANCEPEVATRRARGGAPKAWVKDREIAGAGSVVPVLLGWSRAGDKLLIAGTQRAFLGVEINGQPTVTETGIDVPYTWVTQIAGHESRQELRKHIPWPAGQPQLQELCSGKWTQLGPLFVRLDPRGLMPKSVWNEERCEATFKWPTPPEFYVKVWFLRSWTFRLVAVHISEDCGSFEIDGIPDAMLPTLLWR